MIRRSLLADSPRSERPDSQEEAPKLAAPAASVESVVQAARQRLGKTRRLHGLQSKFTPPFQSGASASFVLHSLCAQ